MLILISGNSFSQSTTCDDIHRYRIFIGNGINALNLGEAIDARYDLEEAIGTNLNGEEITYGVAYNSSAGPITDLVQSLYQLTGSEGSLFLLWLSNLEASPPEFKSKLEILANTINSIATSDVLLHIELYKISLANGEKVLVVAHSQGNLYANAAKQSLVTTTPALPMLSFGIFGVATPTDNIGGSKGPYLTNDKDIIRFVPGALPPNLELLNFSDKTAVSSISPWTAHLMETYLSQKYNARETLIFLAQAAMQQLADPIPDCPPPPPPPPVSSADISYLPSFFAGLTAHNVNCGPNRQSGDIAIGGDGGVTGSGCYEGVTFPTDLPYIYSQNETADAPIINSLRIYQLSISRAVNFLLVKGRLVPDTGVSFDHPNGRDLFNAPTASIHIDAMSRLRSGLSAIADRPCHARIGDNNIAGNSFINADASGIQLKQGNTVLATGSFSDLTTGQIIFNESYKISLDPLHFEMQLSTSSGTSEFKSVGIVWPDKNSPNAFHVSASQMTLTSGGNASVNCVAP